MKIFAAYKESIDRFLSEQHFPGQPANLYNPIIYALGLGGKRLRPVLALAACDLFGGDVEKALKPAVAIEIFHNFTLLHDDIMDQASQRRGKASVYKKWNTDIAILSGDTMFALAYRYFLDAGADNLHAILSVFTQTAIEVCEGQQYDMDFEKRNDVAISEYLEMIRLKTAVLLGASLKIGALVAGADQRQAGLVYDFGVNAGIAFQLKDDYLDAFGNETKFGKSIGGDILANKKTYLYLKCMEMATDDDREKLASFYSGQPEDAAVKVNRVLDVFNKYEIKKVMISEMEHYFGKALEILNRIDAPVGKKKELAGYAEWLYQRDY